MQFYAHTLEGQPKEKWEPLARPNQLLTDHLVHVGELTRQFANCIGLPISGQLIGLLHDLGKFSELFQNYLKSATHLIFMDDEGFVDANGLKGKVDHSTAGAQWIWKHTAAGDKVASISAQILSLCIASHHSGLIDCLSPEGKSTFNTRIAKDDAKTFYTEVSQKLSPTQQAALITILSSIGNEFQERFRSIALANVGHEIGLAFHFGLLTRYLLSCLIDADRLDSSGRKTNFAADWESLVSRLELHLNKFNNSRHVDTIRKDISEACKTAAERQKQVFLLTVPTGGGKTLASLRFALHHAKKHQASRIFYIVPFTSIIEQNAKAVREVFGADAGDIVLEHHSNLTPNVDTESNRLLTENWDSPIVFTTTVQFLEALFASGTRGVRRMHNLANAVLIFDEPQALPIKVTHLFNQAINFLTEQCGASIVLCTATQPLLHKVCNVKGTVKIKNDSSNIIPDAHAHFIGLKRVNVIDRSKVGGYSCLKIAQNIKESLTNKKSLLLIVNTKAVARLTFEEFCKIKTDNTEVYHLSTSMCAAHRQDMLIKIRQSLLEQREVVCISTQLIEAGVDISFECVFRSLAGIDSVAQAAGRCNRNGEMDQLGEVVILNCNEEKLSSLPEIKIAQEKTERILREFKTTPALFDHDLIGIKAIERYYQLYFYDRAGDMDYPIEGDSLLSQLSTNELAVAEYQRINKTSPPIFLRQSFASAGKAFEVIDAPTEGIVVPYNEVARRIIGDLCGEQYDPCRTKELLKKAQRFSVNLFASDKIKLAGGNAISETQEGSGIYFLDERFYDETYGICYNGNAKQPLLQIDEN